MGWLNWYGWYSRRGKGGTQTVIPSVAEESKGRVIQHWDGSFTYIPTPEEEAIQELASRRAEEARRRVAEGNWPPTWPDE